MASYGYTSPNSFSNAIDQIAYQRSHRNLVPASYPKMPRYKQGIRASSRTSKRKLYGRLATNGNVLTNVAQNLCPVIRLEENFTIPQFIPNPTNEYLAGTTGGYAPPMASGFIGPILYQKVDSSATANTYNSVTTYPAINSGVGAQLVQWQSSYLKTEQDILMATAFKGQQPGANVEDYLQNYLGLTSAALLASKGIPAKDFVYRGGTTTHVFVNTGNTQCKLTILEFQPKRMGNITPQDCWDYDNRISAVGLLQPAAAPSELAAGVVQLQRTFQKAGMRPGQLKGGMFNYWFRNISTKTFHLEPGEEFKYKQVFPPWIDRAKMRDIYLSSFVGINQTVQAGDNATAANVPEIVYNSHSRYMCVIGIGESVKFTGTVASADAGKVGLFTGDWAVTHNQSRRSSIQCLLPTRRQQISVVDTPRVLTIAGATQEDFNEEGETMHVPTI